MSDLAGYYIIAEEDVQYVSSNDFEDANPAPTTSVGIPYTSVLGVRAWDDNQTKLMLQLYKENISNVGPLKKFRNKKQMWEKLSTEMEKQMDVVFTAVQIENKFKNVLKRRRNIMRHNRTSGNTRINTPYDLEMEEICAIDDSIIPEVQMAPGTFVKKEGGAETTITSTPTTSILATPHRSPSFPPSVGAHSKVRRSGESSDYCELLETYKKSCEREEARHKEKIETTNKLIDTITKSTTQITNVMVELAKASGKEKND